MNLKHFFTIVLVTLLLAFGQLFAKIGLVKIEIDFSRLSNATGSFVRLITSVHMWISGGITLIAVLLWLTVLKQLPLSLAYPLISLSYVFGFIMAVVFLNEHVSTTKIVGVGVIFLGIYILSNG